MPAQLSPEAQFRTAYKDLIDELGESEALEALDDLHSDAHAAATFDQPLFEDDSEEGDSVDDHEFDVDDRRLVEDDDGILVDEDGDNVYQSLQGEVSLVDVEDGQLVLDGDTYEAKSHIKAVDYQHRTFDGDRKVWLVDESVIDDLHRNLNGGGFLFLDARDEADEDEGPDPEAVLREFIDEASDGDWIRVEYEQKNGEGSNDKEGIVREARLPEEEEFDDVPVLRFQRADEQRMYVRPDNYGTLALFTAMSHAPFVGDVTDLDVVDEA